MKLWHSFKIFQSILVFTTNKSCVSGISIVLDAEDIRRSTLKCELLKPKDLMLRGVGDTNKI